MKTSFLIYLISVFLFSCTEIKRAGEEEPVELLLPKDLILYEENDSLFHTSDFKSCSRNFCNQECRQILIVDALFVIHANYNNNNVVNAQRSILLRGNPSPSSCKDLKYAYLIFVNDLEKLRKPEFKHKNGSAYIRLYYPDDYFDALLSTLRNAKDIYCWRGVFSDNHIYGDIHVSLEKNVTSGYN